MSEAVIRLHPADNVLIALKDHPAGAQPDGTGITVAEAVPRGHKIAAKAIPTGEKVVRYGQIIGQATKDIPAGGHVHSQNLGMGPHSSDYAIGTECRPLPPLPPRSFMGFHRADGSVGTRNYLGILTSVNCSGSVCPLHCGSCREGPGSWLDPGDRRDCAYRPPDRLRHVGNE